MWPIKKKIGVAKIEIDDLVKRIQELTVVNAELWLAANQQTGSGINPYKTLDTQVEAIINRYEGNADYGYELVQRLVTLAAAFSLPHELELDCPKGAEKEKKFIESFVDVNNLDQNGTYQLSIESHLQGQILVALLWDTDNETVKLQYMPWNEYKYKIVLDGIGNLSGQYKAAWEDSSGKKLSLNDNQFQYLGFNKRLKSGEIQGRPRLGVVLKRLENVSYDLDDWRQVNKLYGHPTPYFKFENQADADKLMTLIQSIGWKIGIALASSGEMSLVSPSTASPTFLDKGIEVHLKVVAGATGIGIHFLGFPNVLSNRATAESLGEPIEIAARTDMLQWMSFFEGLFNKAIMLANEHRDQKLRTGLVKPKMQPITDRQWTIIEKVFMPATKDGLISRRRFAEQVPGIDPEQNEEELSEEKSTKPLSEEDEQYPRFEESE